MHVHIAFAPGPAPGPAAGSSPSREPMFNLPPMVTILLLVNVAVHLLRLLLPPDVDESLLATFGFVPARYSGAMPFDWPAIVAPITHQFLHVSALHLLVNMATLMAFGAGVERRIGPRRVLGFTLLCGILAAGAQLAVDWGSPAVLIGASGAISGLFGAVLRLLHRHGGLARLWPLALLWIAVTVLFGVIGFPGVAEDIAWVAHIGGFAAGVILFPLFDRPTGARQRP
jgi:membrane associated rhomboid family serine protease